MDRKRRWIASLAFCAVAVGTALHALYTLPRALEDVKAWVRQSHPSVAQMSRAEFDAAAARDPILLLDVRTAAEFAVSHKPGAIHVPPEASTPEVLARFGGELQGKTVFVYCSVGKRSSELAERLGPALVQNGALAVYNIEGGIFGWHNDGRPLMRNSSRTAFVHPYSEEWASYLEQRALARYEPGEEAPVARP